MPTKLGIAHTLFRLVPVAVDGVPRVGTGLKGVTKRLHQGSNFLHGLTLLGLVIAAALLVGFLFLHVHGLHPLEKLNLLLTFVESVASVVLCTASTFYSSLRSVAAPCSSFGSRVFRTESVQAFLARQSESSLKGLGGSVGVNNTAFPGV